jgi:hypothetical protein
LAQGCNTGHECSPSIPLRLLRHGSEEIYVIHNDLSIGNAGRDVTPNRNSCLRRAEPKPSGSQCRGRCNPIEYCFERSHARHFTTLDKEENQLKALHPIRSYRNFKARCQATVAAFRDYYFAALTAARDLTAAIRSHNERVSELHGDIKKIEHAVGFLYRAERYQRESNGHKVNF